MANGDKPEPRGIVVTREVALERIAAIVAKYPDLVSFDPADAQYESTLFRLKTDPGVERSKRDGWMGEVREWYFGSYTMADQQTGELQTLPSLALLTTDGVLIRFTNSQPALRAWLSLIREIGPERIRQGLRVRAAKRQSQSTPGTYWTILPA